MTDEQDQSRPGTGIVHLGLGAFFRAFGCIYVAEAMRKSGGDWGIVGVSLNSSSTRDKLKAQNWQYTSVSLGRDETSTERISVLNEVIFAPENPQRVLDVMASSDTRIVSLTVTEKGYHHNPATGRLRIDDPDIQHDLTHNLPRTALGYFVRACEIRMLNSQRGFTVLVCDNLPNNGNMVRALVLEIATEIDPSLAQWIEKFVKFPCTMVDRITPSTTAQDLKLVEELTGMKDLAPVLHEEFSQWVIEDDFAPGERPDFEAAGVQLVADVAPFEEMKLRMLNGTHSALAYSGYLAGHETIADTVSDPVFSAFCSLLWSEIIPSLTAPPGTDLNDYAETLLKRYQNPKIQHRTWQIAMDGSQKIPQRIIATISENLESGRPNKGLSFAIAAWIRYVIGEDEKGQPIDVRDPFVGEIQSVIKGARSDNEIVAAVLGLEQIFPAELSSQISDDVADCFLAIRKSGTRAALQQIIETNIN